MFISRLATSFMISFSYIFLRKEMNISKTRMTFVFVSSGVAKVVIFLSSSIVIKKLGTTACIILGIFSSFVRLLSTSYATKLWQLLQLFHSFGFALSCNSSSITMMGTFDMQPSTPEGIGSQDRVKLSSHTHAHTPAHTRAGAYARTRTRVHAHAHTHFKYNRYQKH